MNIPTNIGYQIYEAQRPRSTAEQRAADIRTGEFAAGVARVGRSVKEAVMRTADMRRTGGHAREATAEAVASDGGMSLADLERLYAAPCGPAQVDRREAGGECTVRSS